MSADDLATSVLSILMNASEPVPYEGLQARTGVECDRTLCGALMTLEAEGQIGRTGGVFHAL